jgi:Fur family ferric uptake transcriptional regulator
MKTCHKDFFQDHGLKNTPSRDAIYHLLEDQLLTADQVFQKLIAKGFSLSFSTVYRILEKFVEKGIVEAVKLQGEASVLYQVVSTHHHHQLVCTRCHQIETIEECPIDAFEQMIAKQHKFTIESHQMILYGICDHCKQKSTD